MAGLSAFSYNSLWGPLARGMDLLQEIFNMGVDLKSQFPSSTFFHVTLRQLSWGLEPSPKAPATSNTFGCLSCHLSHILYHPL